MTSGPQESDKDVDIRSIIGKQIRQYRERHDPPWTQNKLAQVAGLSTDDRVSLYELGKSVPSISDLNKIAKALGVPLRALLQRETDDDMLSRLQRVVDIFGEARAVALTADAEGWTEFIRDLQHALRRAKKITDYAVETASGKRRRRRVSD